MQVFEQFECVVLQQSEDILQIVSLVKLFFVLDWHVNWCFDVEEFVIYDFFWDVCELFTNQFF